MVGLRNLDEREKGLVRQSGVHAYTMKDIDLRGMAAVMREALDLIMRRWRRAARFLRHGWRRSLHLARSRALRFAAGSPTASLTC